MAELSNNPYTPDETDGLIADAADAIIGGDAGLLDTLTKIRTSLGNDPAFATTVANAVAAKVSANNATLTGLTRADNVQAKRVGAVVYAAEYGMGSDKTAAQNTAALDAAFVAARAVGQVERAHVTVHLEEGHVAPDPDLGPCRCGRPENERDQEP